MSSHPSATCTHVVGMLVPRACDAPATANCARCGEARCPEHRGAGEACLACRAGAPAPGGSLVTIPPELTFDPAALASFEVVRPDDPANAWSDLT